MTKKTNAAAAGIAADIQREADRKNAKETKDKRLAARIAADIQREADRKNAKDGVAKDDFGCRVGSQAGTINAALPKKGEFTIADVVKKSKCTSARVTGHLKSLVTKGRITPTKEKGTYKIK